MKLYYISQQLREAFDRESLTSGRPRLLLTAAVAAGKKNIDSGYDVPAIGRYYHVHFMSYFINCSIFSLYMLL